MPRGSNAALIRRSSVHVVGAELALEVAELDDPDAVLAGDRPAELDRLAEDLAEGRRGAPDRVLVGGVEDGGRDGGCRRRRGRTCRSSGRGARRRPGRSPPSRRCATGGPSHPRGASAAAGARATGSAARRASSSSAASSGDAGDPHGRRPLELARLGDPPQVALDRARDRRPGRRSAAPPRVVSSPMCAKSSTAPMQTASRNSSVTGRTPDASTRDTARAGVGEVGRSRPCPSRSPPARGRGAASARSSPRACPRCRTAAGAGRSRRRP